MLVRQIIVSAFNDLQIYAPGETVNPVDMARGFETANMMLDTWSNEYLMCYAELEQALPLVPGISQYTLGPGGTLPFRPLKINTGPGTAYVQDTNGNNYGVNSVSREVWNLIGNRVISNSNFPDTIFYDAQFPVGFLNVFPVPNISYTLYFDSFQELSAFPGIDVDINFPRGYSEALFRNLAIALEPAYPTARLSRNTVDLAAKSKANIKRTNSKVLFALYDAELTPRGAAVYNIYTDGYNSSTGR